MGSWQNLPKFFSLGTFIVFCAATMRPHICLMIVVILLPAAPSSPADNNHEYWEQGDNSALEGSRISLISPSYNMHMRTPVRITYRVLRPREEGAWGEGAMHSEDQETLPSGELLSPGKNASCPKGFSRDRRALAFPADVNKEECEPRLSTFEI